MSSLNWGDSLLIFFVFAFFPLLKDKQSEQNRKRKKTQVCWTDKVSSPNCVCYFESILIVARYHSPSLISPFFTNRHWTKKPFHLLSIAWILWTYSHAPKNICVPNALSFGECRCDKSSENLQICAQHTHIDTKTSVRFSVQQPNKCSIAILYTEDVAFDKKKYSELVI